MAAAGATRAVEPGGGPGGTLTLTFAQRTPPTPGQPDKAPLVIPIAVGLIDDTGAEVAPTRVLEMTEARQSFAFHGLSRRPVPSVLRGFSAPVIAERETTDAERAFLLAHDTDPFCRWEAGRQLARGTLVRAAARGAEPDALLLDALLAVADDARLDPAFQALCLALPGEDEVAQVIHEGGGTPDPEGIHAAHEGLTLALARRLSGVLPALRERGRVPGPFDPGAEPAGRRALGQAALWLLTRLDGGDAARDQFESASNMTEEVGALSCLLAIGAGEAEAARFHERWREDALVTDKWFALVVARSAPERAAETAAALTRHPEFGLRPNRFRAVIGTLAAHPAGFHAAGGAGYRLVVDWLLRMDAVNPQTAARMAGAFETWRRYDEGRRALMAEALDRIAREPDLSRDTREMVARIRTAS